MGKAAQNPTCSAEAICRTRWCIFSTRDLPRPSLVKIPPRVRGEQPLAAPSFKIMVATCSKAGVWHVQHLGQSIKA